MKSARKLIRFLSKALTALEIAAILICTVYAVYALTDDRLVYVRAGRIQKELLTMKPEELTEDGAKERPGFDELWKLNADVCAWLSLEETNIDYPVLQGRTNLTYLQTDIYGEPSLSGSIFLDVRNDRGFTDDYHLIYGHSMDRHTMFGDLHNFRDEAFWKKETEGALILPERSLRLRPLICSQIPASDPVIFDPGAWRMNPKAVIAAMEEKAEQINDELLEEMKGMERPELVALACCSGYYTDARTVLLCLAEERA